MKNENEIYLAYAKALIKKGKEIEALKEEFHSNYCQKRRREILARLDQIDPL